ncbi:MAG: transporter ATP-binding protein [Polaromonas sp.]|nr:transporter ATP-binding protein [Polaromonas sp.]
MSNALLVADKLCKSFGGLQALSDVSLTVNRGEFLGIVGPHGAGKSVLINLVTKFYPATSGQLQFADVDATSFSRLQMARSGVARTFQNIRLFKRMTVLENVLVADPVTAVSPFRSAVLRRSRLERATELLDLMRLGDLADQVAGNLPYGAARRLEIARALATGPKLLLLDEPAAGMNEEETAALVEDIGKARERVEGILLVEHDMSLIRALSHRLVGLIAGRKVAEGSVDAVLSDPQVIEAYLGPDEEAETARMAAETTS